MPLHLTHLTLPCSTLPYALPLKALLANIASLYAVYHGPKGLQTIAQRVNGMASVLAAGAQKLGHGVPNKPFFDTVAITVGDAKKVRTCGSAADMGWGGVGFWGVGLQMGRWGWGGMRCAFGNTVAITVGDAKVLW